MKSILDQMEEHIAAIRNLQRNFDFHSKRLERLMRELSVNHYGQVENNQMGEKSTDVQCLDSEDAKRQVNTEG